MEYKERIARTINCRDCDYIPKVREAGTVVDGIPPLQIMHNGIKIIQGAYHGDWMTEIIRSLHGHHEPQEEKVFYEVLRTLPETATMIELGSFWAYYSMWFQKSVKNPINYLIEPNPQKIEVGKRHFSLNKMVGHFENVFIGKDSKDKAFFNDWDDKKYQIPRIALDDFIEKNKIPFVHIVRADIQGAEYEMLLGCQKSISQNKIAFFFVSTHGNMHSQCINFFIEHGFTIVASHTIAESVSADGLIVAKAGCVNGLEHITIGSDEHYSQFKQDKILDLELFEKKENGLFVDVGATDGYHFSNTLFFEKQRRWKGICIEPNPIEFEKLKHSNRTCIKENYAISLKEGETDFLAIDGYGKGLSGIISLYDPRHLKRIEKELKGHDSKRHVFKVEAITLQKLLDSHQITYVDYCSIDVEGAEMQVLESIDFDKTYIKCFTIENNYGLDQETRFLTSKGYRLWKKVGCDDIFVRDEEYSAEAMHAGNAVASEEKYSIEDIKKKISTHYRSFLPFKEQMAVEKLDPLRILDYTRFDVPAKVIYARHRDWGMRSEWPLRVYDEHIRVFNGYDERDGTGKKGLGMFLKAFDNVIDSIRTRGFDSDTSVIPITTQGELLEGAHRLAACLIFEKAISTVKFDFKPWVYDYRFFLSRGLSIESADAIALEFCRLKKNTHLVFLFPSAVDRDDQTLEILRKYCEIVYEKKILLRNDGPLLLMRQIYRDENWLGNYKNSFAGTRLKVRECFKSHEPLRLFVVEADNNDELKKAKQLIRDMYRIGNHSVHITDTYEESLRLAQLLLNSNGIHFLNFARINHFERFEHNLGSYKKDLSGVEEAWFCVGGSAVMALYGLREARDIDYLHFQEPLPRREGALVNSHNKEAKHYPLTIDDIIFDPKNHFYYDGVKFCSLNVIQQMKKNRGEIKDQQDILSMAPLIKPEISIIILNYNGLKNIKACIESIEKNTEESYEIIIIDNASTDGSLEYLHNVKNTILIENEENIGCPPARALALPLAQGNFVVLLDNDTVVTPGWIPRFKAHFERYPDIGILGPRSNYVSGEQLVQNVPYKNAFELEAFARKWGDDHKGQLTTTCRLVGFCMFMSRTVIAKIGNIDATFGKFGFEDDDYSWRAIIAGFKIAIANDVFIHHSGGPQTKGNPRYNRQLLDAWEVFKKKWGLPTDLKYGAPYNPLPYLLQVFRKEHHFVPIGNPNTSRFSQKRGNSKTLLHYEQLKTKSEEGSKKSKIPLGEDITSSKIQFKKKSTPNMVSIIIPVTGHAKQLKKCIENIRKCTPEAHEIIFVENGCKGGILKWIKEASKRKSNYRLVRAGKEAGQAECFNVGMEASSGEYIVLLYKHVMVAEGWLGGMLRCINRADDVCIVGPMTNTKASGRQCAADSGHVKINQLEEYAGAFLERNHHRRVPSREVADFCMLFRRSLVEQIGPFDEELEQGSGCADYCLRAELEGYKSVIAGDVFVLCEDFPPQGNKRSFAYKWKDIDAKSHFGERLGVLNAITGAEKTYQEEEVDKAIVKLLDGLKYCPEEEAIYHRLTEVLIDSGRFKDGLDAINSIPEDKRDSARSLELAGYCKAGLELYDEAAQLADRALSVNPSSASTLNLMGVLAHGRDDKNASENFLKKAIAADPGYGEAYTNLGILEWETGRKEDALEMTERGFILSPTAEDCRTAYLSAVSETVEFERAEGVFREAKAIYPENRRIAFLLIDMLIRQEKYDSAMQDIREAMVTFGINDGILSAAQAVLDRFDAQETKDIDKKPVLSLCMIVKNEENCLARCLMSAIPVVDEIIIVDTGSTDRTKAIAKTFGSKIYDFEWTDDFSEARNYSLSKVTGNWILLLDADEVISARDYDRLRRIVNEKNQAQEAYRIITRNYVNPPYVIGWTCNSGEYPDEETGTGWYPSRKVRLFPNKEGIYFENPVHEFVETSLSQMGIEIAESDIPVHHYGQLDREHYVAKGNRYYPLGKKKLAQKGGDLKSLIELAVQAGGEFGKYEEAVALWQKVLDIDRGNTKALLNMSGALLKLEKYEAARTAADMAMKLAPDLKEAIVLYSTCEVLIGEPDKTIPILEDLINSVPNYPLAFAILAAAYGIEGQKRKGFEQVKNLARMGFSSADYLYSIADILNKLGKKSRAISLLEFAVEIGKGTKSIRELLSVLLQE